MTTILKLAVKRSINAIWYYAIAHYPLAQNADTLFLGVSDPCNIDGQDEFRFATGRNIEPLLLENKQLESAIRRIYGRELGETTNMAVVMSVMMI